MASEANSLVRDDFETSDPYLAKDSLSRIFANHKVIHQLLMQYEDALDGFWDFLNTNEYLFSNLKQKNLKFTFQLYEMKELYEEVEKEKPKMVVSEEFLMDYLKVIRELFIDKK